MAISIFSNFASVDTQLRLGRTQDLIAKNMARLSSGLRITDASDDPAGLGVATAFDTQVRSFNQAMRNTNDGISMLQTVDGALGQMHGALQRMRELAVQASNGTLTSTDRANLQTEFAQLQTEITRIATSTKFGNIQLLNADSTITLQVGANNAATDAVSVTVRQNDAATMKVDSIKVDTQTGATASIDSIDAAIARVSSDRASLGAMQNRLRVALDNDQVFAKNLGAAVGRIRDVDVAAESALLARNNVLQQAGIAMLAQANQTPLQAMALLRF
jgi:flagellin